MFVSIDMDKLEFLHKHPDHDTLSALAFLEACDRSVVIENTDREHFGLTFSPLDLRMLHKHTTGQEITGTDDQVVRMLLIEIVDNHIAPSIAKWDELDAQVYAVEDDLHKGIPWKYALGSKRPAKQMDLYGLRCAPLYPIDAQRAAAMAPQRLAKRGATPTPAAPSAPPTLSAAKAPRASSVRPTIWAVADEMWAAAGSPTDVPTVLALRKKMMAELEEKHSVKKTSSSNELGNWQKDRLG